MIIINTGGQEIRDEPKVAASMKIIARERGYNHPGDEANIYNGEIGIEIRGKYSASLPQKPYGFETRDNSGNNKNISLLNMPEENDWILLANYNDKSFVRNSLSFQIFRNMGHYAPRAKLCEVIVNNSYEGIYLLTEKIKRDKNRVDISELDMDDNAGDSLTGGYIFAVDYYDESNSWKGSYSPPGYPSKNVYFVYDYPKYNEITNPQRNYIKNYISSFEQLLYGSNFSDPVSGYRSYVNLTSFIDYFIVNELARNVDGYKKSCFYHKNKNSKDGLLEAGPVWDFDWAWKDLWDCSIFQATNGSGWAYKILQCDPWPTPNGWIPRMMTDPLFVDQLKNRYTFLRKTTLSDFNINFYVDSVKTLVSDAQMRHYERWKILGERVGAPEIGDPATTYDEEIEDLKNWISRRLKWLDQQMLITSKQELGQNPNFRCSVFPNPVHQFVELRAERGMVGIVIFNITGQRALQVACKSVSEYKLDISGLLPGVYILRIDLDNGQVLTNKFTVE